MKKIFCLIAFILTNQGSAEEFSCEILFDSSLSNNERDHKFEQLNHNLDQSINIKKYDLNNFEEMYRVTNEIRGKLSCRDLYLLKYTFLDIESPHRIILMRKLIDRKKNGQLNVYQENLLNKEIDKNKDFFKNYSLASYTNRTACHDPLLLLLSDKPSKNNKIRVKEYRYNYERNEIYNAEKDNGFQIVMKDTSPLCGNDNNGKIYEYIFGEPNKVSSPKDEFTTVVLPEHPYYLMNMDDITCNKETYSYEKSAYYKLSNNLDGVANKNGKKISLNANSKVQFVKLEPVGENYQVKLIHENDVYRAIPCRWIKSKPIPLNIN